MRTITTFLFLLATLNIAFAQTEPRQIYQGFEFRSGGTEYLFADNVKFRKGPDVQAEVIDLLPIGSAVEILSKTEDYKEFDGINSPWYQIKYKGQTGYVLGALIALDKLENQSGTAFYAQMKKDKEGNERLKIRSKTKENNHQEFILETLYIDRGFSLEISDGKDLSRIDNIIGINLLAEACGEDGGIVYVFWRDNKLTQIAHLSSVGDGGVYHLDEKFIFPNDPEGVRNKIVYLREEGEMVDEQTNWYKTIVHRREYNWNGRELEPKFSKPEDEIEE